MRHRTVAKYIEAKAGEIGLKYEAFNKLRNKYPNNNIVNKMKNRFAIAERFTGYTLNISLKAKFDKNEGHLNIRRNHL